MNISVVIPVYNSEQSLTPLVERLKVVLAHEAEHFEIVMVDDASMDGSWTLLQQLERDHEEVRCISLMRNYGQHNALLCGILRAKYEVIVTIDDDLQHPPEEVPVLLRKLEEGCDVVYGAPEQEQHGLFRDFASVITKLTLRNAMGAEMASHIGAFRAFRASSTNAFSHYKGMFVSIDVLLTWGTNRFGVVKVRHEPRTLGASNYSFRKLFMHAMNMMTGYSVMPLQLASLVGFACTLFGLCVLVYVIGRYFIEGNVVRGFPFLASIIAIFSGAQLFALGIMGEYLSRMHFRTMDRPPYVVRHDDTLGGRGHD